MTLAIAIMVKTPGHSPVKTRLAASHGRAFAEQCHRLAAAAVASVLQSLADAGDVQPYWAVAEAGALGDPTYAALPRLRQGEGGLGERMGRVHQELQRRHGAALLLGADSPQLEAALLRPAVDWLRASEPRTTIGLAEDGGFWTFGCNGAIAPDAWTAVSYSRRETGRDFRLAMASRGTCLTLPTLHDLDCADDMAPMRAALAALRSPSRQQQALLEWLERFVPGLAPGSHTAARNEDGRNPADPDRGIDRYGA
jgi:uncharacterized protein